MSVGLMPLVGAGRVNAAASLKESNRATGSMQSGVRNALAVTQIAIAIMLLIGAGLMTKSLWALIGRCAGFSIAGPPHRAPVAAEKSVSRQS